MAAATIQNLIMCEFIVSRRVDAIAVVVRVASVGSALRQNANPQAALPFIFFFVSFFFFLQDACMLDGQ
jgi:hypothetical protein